MLGVGSYLGTTTYPNTYYGQIKTYIAALHSNMAADFLRRMMPHSRIHQQVIPLALDFQRIWEQDKGKRRSAEQKALVETAHMLLIQAKEQRRNPLIYSQ